MCQEKEGGRELTNIEDTMDPLIRQLQAYIKKSNWETNYSDQK